MQPQPQPTTSDIAVRDQTLFAISDNLAAWFESREMIVAQLAEPLEDGAGEPLREQLAEIDAELARLGTELATKTDNIAGVLRRMNTEQDYLKAEQERIHGRRKTMERAEKWLCDYVVSVMHQRGMKQLKTADNTLFLRNSDSVVIEDPALVPEKFKNISVKMPAWFWRFMCEQVRAAGSFAEEVDALRVTEDISLSAVKKAIKAGETVDGADVAFAESLVLR